MASDLPSYHDATTRSDWLALVAPHVTARSYAACCRVCSHWRDTFAPRLWSDPLRIVRALGVHPDDDLAWYLRFVFKHVPTVRERTRSLVLSLDLRHFGRHTYEFSLDASRNRTVAGSFRYLHQVFPSLRTVLLDGHPELDPALFASPVYVPALGGRQPQGQGQDATGLSTTTPPLQLSLAHCQRVLPAAFFRAPYLGALVYLDVSHLRGGGLGASLAEDNLPALRVLKARGRELDDHAARELFQALGRRVWSLDLSDNRLSDAAVDALAHWCFPAESLRAGDANFQREGRVVQPHGFGSDQHGPFLFIQESEQSADFFHPERYFVDAPVYTAHDSDNSHPHQQQDAPPQTRADGRSPVRDDSEDGVKRVFAGATSDLAFMDLCHGHGGVTHLHLNNNRLTAAGVAKLLRLSPGHLQHFACDGVRMKPLRAHEVARSLPGPSSSSTSSSSSAPSSLSPAAVAALTRGMTGLLGQAHLFRPAVSSNLRSLRAHHSVVTNMPTPGGPLAATADALRLAELMGARAARIFPVPFVPDMNPRLTSLTLTDIPRQAFGTLLVDSLKRFLTRAAEQERAIRTSAAHDTSRRAPALLRGLRHLRLEFSPVVFAVSKAPLQELQQTSSSYSHAAAAASDRARAGSLASAPSPTAPRYGSAAAASPRPSVSGPTAGPPGLFVATSTSSLPSSTSPPASPPAAASSLSPTSPTTPEAARRPSLVERVRGIAAGSHRHGSDGNDNNTAAQGASSSAAPQQQQQQVSPSSPTPPPPPADNPSATLLAQFVTVVVPYNGKHLKVPVWTGPPPFEGHGTGLDGVAGGGVGDDDDNGDDGEGGEGMSPRGAGPASAMGAMGGGVVYDTEDDIAAAADQGNGDGEGVAAIPVVAAAADDRAHNQRHRQEDDLSDILQAYASRVRSSIPLRAAAGVGPATPCHAAVIDAAGVRPLRHGTYIFAAAWDDMLLPPTTTTGAAADAAEVGSSAAPAGLAPPPRAGTRLLDVAAELRRWRKEAREARDLRGAAGGRGEEDGDGADHHHHHLFWTGRLELVLPPPPAANPSTMEGTGDSLGGVGEGALEDEHLPNIDWDGVAGGVDLTAGPVLD